MGKRFAILEGWDENGLNDDGARKELPPKFTSEALVAIEQDALARPADIIRLHGNPMVTITRERYQQLREVLLRERGSILDGAHETCAVCEKSFQPVRFGPEYQYGNFIILTNGVDKMHLTSEAVCYFCKKEPPEGSEGLKRISSYPRDEADRVIKEAVTARERVKKNAASLLSRAWK